MNRKTLSICLIAALVSLPQFALAQSVVVEDEHGGQGGAPAPGQWASGRRTIRSRTSPRHSSSNDPKSVEKFWDGVGHL